MRLCYWLVLIGMGLAAMLPAGVAQASYTPPTMITVQMYVLEDDGSLPVIQQLKPCEPGDLDFGCTALPDGSPAPRPYPYTSNPVTIPIETDYLLDVVPGEMRPQDYDGVAVAAQAVAARSFAYWHIQRGSPINNSTDYQMFVPYRFESLLPVTFPSNATTPCASSNLHADQREVCRAVANRHYLAESSSDGPVKAAFFQDAVGATRTDVGGFAHLQGVAEPISTTCEVKNAGPGLGMSSKGAARWARGNQCASPVEGNRPWSVRWSRAAQILVHYYTGIHIRDASAGNRVLTPTARWNLLAISWEGGTPRPPPLLQPGGRYPVTLQIQNTGTFAWSCNQAPDFRSYTLRAVWERGDGTVYVGQDQVAVCGLTPGSPAPTVTLALTDLPPWPAGSYTLRLDVQASGIGGSFRFGEGGWPAPSWLVCLSSCQQRQAIARR